MSLDRSSSRAIVVGDPSTGAHCPLAAGSVAQPIAEIGAPM